MPSMPTASRTSPGVTPGQLLLRGELECVVDAGWMTSERTSPMFATWLCSCRRVDEPLAGVDAALDLERDDSAGTLR